MKRFLLVASLLLAAALLGACQGAPAASTPSLKVGLLPIVDVLPMYVAEEEGYFAQENVAVELVPFTSAVERDSALQAGQIDGQLNDLVATLLLDKGEQQYAIVRQTFQGSPAMPMMYILAAPGSGITTPADLKGVEIGISGNSVIEYTTQAMLKAAGLDAAEIKTVEVSKIPVRFDMLMKGQLRAATLPDPLASLAVAQGATVVVDDSASGVGQSVMTFRRTTLEEKPEAVRAFLAAYERAVETINANPDQYKALLVERAKVPEEIKDSYAMPPYPPARVPTEAEFADVVEWMVANELLAAPVAYDQVVETGFLPAR